MINEIDKMREELYEPCREKSLQGLNIEDTIHVIILTSKITNSTTVYNCSFHEP